MQVSKKMCYWK